MLAGVSPHEIGLVVFLLVLVMIAPKVGKIGETIGGFFERVEAGGGSDSTQRRKDAKTQKDAESI
jgi:hypothetical protein